MIISKDKLDAIETYGFLRGLTLGLIVGIITATLVAVIVIKLGWRA